MLFKYLSSYTYILYLKLIGHRVTCLMHSKKYLNNKVMCEYFDGLEKLNF